MRLQSHAKIAYGWWPAACKLYPGDHQSQANFYQFFHFACDWRPRGDNLHATGGHSGTIHMRLVANLVQSRQFF